MPWVSVMVCWLLLMLGPPSPFKRDPALFQKTSSVTAAQVFWQRPSGAIRQTHASQLSLSLSRRLGLQQTQQHTVPPRGAAETAEGRGRRYCPKASEDPRKVERAPPACWPAQRREPASVRITGPSVPPPPTISGRVKMLYGSCHQGNDLLLHNAWSTPTCPTFPLFKSMNV